MESLLAANRGAPQTLVNRVLELGEVSFETVLLQVVDLILACECHIACRGDDADLGSQNLEGHIETYLVVTCACRAVCNVVGANLFGVLDDGDSLEDTLRRYRDGIGTVTQYVTEYHIFNALLVILLLDVECSV